MGGSKDDESCYATSSFGTVLTSADPLNLQDETPKQLVTSVPFSNAGALR